MTLISASEFLNVKENRALKAANEPLGSRQTMLRRIGVFEMIDGEYIGHIATLNFRCKATIKANPYRKFDGDPQYIVLQTDAEVFHCDVGFGWDRKTDGNHAQYMMVLLDDPSFDKPMQCIVVKGPQNFYYMYWDRIAISDQDIEKQVITEECIPYIGVYRPIDKVTDYLIEIYPSLQEIWDPD